MREVLSTLAMCGFVFDLWRSPPVKCCFALIAMAGSGDTLAKEDSLARPCQSYIAAFAETPTLREVAWIDFFPYSIFLAGKKCAVKKYRPSELILVVGMTILVDHSGKLYSKEKCTIKDLIANKEASI